MNLETFLQKRRGTCECESGENYTYGYPELRQNLIKQEVIQIQNALPDQAAGPTYESDRVIEAANEVNLLLKQFDLLVMEEKYDIKWKNDVSNKYNDKDNVHLYAEGTRKTIKCIAKEFLFRHLWKIVLFVSIGGWVVSKIRAYLIRRLVLGLARDFYRDVKETILASKSSSPFGKSIGLS